MAKVHFAPYSAIKYVGSKAKDFNTSLARPKPTLKKGDIVIVEKKDAFNLVSKGFGEFVAVNVIEFTKQDSVNANEINELENEIIRLTDDNARLESEIIRLTDDNARLESENAQLLLELASVPERCTSNDMEIDEAFGALPETNPESLEIILDDVTPLEDEVLLEDVTPLEDEVPLEDETPLEDVTPLEDIPQKKKASKQK